MELGVEVVLANGTPRAARRTLWHVLDDTLPTCFGTVSLPLPRGALLRLGQLSPRRHAWLEGTNVKNHERQITRTTPTPCARIDPDSYQQ
jgi:hypothetical protein